MKTKLFFSLVLFVGMLLLNNNLIAQEAKGESKALRANPNATANTIAKGEPVPGAEIMVEYEGSGPAEKTQFDVILKSKLTSNDKGEFSLVLTQDQLKKFPDEFKLKLTIKPKDPSKYSVELNSVVVKVKKSAGPKFDFVVTYQKSMAKTNKGSFVVNAKTQN